MSDLRRDLARGKVAPVYLLYGNEPGLMRAELEAIRKAVLTAGFEAFNHERFSGRELEGIGPVLDSCAQLPLMAERRLVELDEPEVVGKARAGSDAAKVHQAALVGYLAAPNPSTVLVMLSSGIDGRSKLVTATKKVGVVLKFEALKRDRDAVEFVHEEARRSGWTLAPEAADRLVEAVGTHPSELMAALERASLHAGPGRPVGTADVEAVAGRGREAVIFDLTDAVGSGQRDQALEVLARLFRDSGTPEIGQANATLAMLIRQLRLVFLAKAVGGRPEAIGAATGVPPFVARKLAQQARGFHDERLRVAYAGLARLDRDLKGGAASVVRAPYVALQRWILEVCGALPQVAPRT